MHPSTPVSEVAAAISQRWDNRDIALPARRGVEMQYWKRCDRDRCYRHTNKRNGLHNGKGWVIVGPSMAEPLEHARWINEKHMTPLPQYGTMPYGEPGAANPELRYEQILNHPDGIFEFPADQIISFGWDMVPLVAELRPEVANHPRTECVLGGCINRRFATKGGYERHIKAIHREAVGTRAMGEAMRTSIKESLTQPMDAPTVGAAVASAIAEMMPQLSKLMIQAVRESANPSVSVKQARVQRRRSVAAGEEVSQYEDPLGEAEWMDDGDPEL
jgi:hypothetical protein